MMCSYTIACCVALWTSAALSPAQTGVRLSGDMPYGVDGDVAASAAGETGMSPDGAWTVYRADSEVDERFELLSVPTAGGVIHKLNPGTPFSVTDFAISADSSRVVFLAAESPSVLHLYSVPIDGSLPALELAPSQASALIRSYVISPDSTTVALLSGPLSELYALHLVPITGGTPALVGTRVSGSGLRIEHDRVLFRSSAFTANPAMFEVLSAPLDGSAPAVRLNATLLSGRSVLSFLLTPDGSTVVYLANLDDPSKYQLYAVPHDLSAPSQLLHDPLLPNSSVTAYAIDPTGSRVVYVAAQLVANRRELFVADLPAGGNNLRLSGPFPPQSITDFAIDPTGARVAYTVTSRLYTVPIDGSQAALLLATGVLDYRFSPDGSLLFYRESPGRLEVVKSDGSLPPLALAAPLQVEDFELSADQSTLTFLARSPAPADTNRQLYELRWNGGPSLIRLNPPLATPLEVYAFSVTPDGSRVTYRADQEADERFELFTVPAHGAGAAAKLSGALAPSLFPIGDVTEERVSPDGAYAVYQANQDDPSVPELYAARCDGSAPAFKLNDALPADGVYFDFSIAHDASRVFYRHGPATGVNELCVVPIDRGTPPIRLSAPGGYMDGAYRVTADDTRVLYAAAADSAQIHELYSVPSDGSATPTRLHPPLSATQDVESWYLSADDARAVFTGNLAVDTRRDLFSAPLDGSAAPLQLTASMPAFASVLTDLVVTASGRVVYLADAGLDGCYEVYSVPEDGSSAPVRLSGNMALDGDAYETAASADGQRVLYLADQETNGVFGLFSAPADGSSPAVRVNAALVPEGDVVQGAITPDGQRVVYLADQNMDEKFELFSAAPDGTNVQRLSQAGANEVLGFRVTPDGSRVVYFYGNNATTRLFSAPVGVATPIPLSPPLAAPRKVLAFLVDASGSVLYALQESPALPVELFVVRQDGAFPARQVSPPGWTGNVITSVGYGAPFSLTPTADRALFIADRSDTFVLELFTTNLRKTLASPAPGRSVTTSVPLRAATEDAAWLVTPTKYADPGAVTPPLDSETGSHAPRWTRANAGTSTRVKLAGQVVLRPRDPR